MTQLRSAPSEIRVTKDRRMLVLVLAEGGRDEFPAEMLRVMSPSAEVQGHGESDRKTVGGKRDVTIADVRPVGHYAIRIVFDDGHDTGLFTWNYLSELGQEKDERWQAYLDELRARGMSRDV